MITRLLTRVSGLALVLACGGERPVAPDEYGGLEPLAGARAEFTVLPAVLDSFPILTPLGNLNPPGHVLPTDHVYFYQVRFDVWPRPQPTAVLPIVAPASGVVNFVLHQQGGDYKIQFVVTRDFGYYLDHVNLLPGIEVGDTIMAGQQVGTTNPGGAFDLGAYDNRVTLTGFVNPKRYPETSLHTVSPWKYFVEPLRSQLYAKVRRHPEIADKDGKIDFGIPGKLVGDWYEQSVPNDHTAGSPAGWTKSIAFVYDYYDPRLRRVSIGGTVAPAGIWTIPDDAPDPATVSVSSGRIVYPLLYTESRTQWGLMVVQMLDDETVRLQVFPGSQQSTADFDAGAFTYKR